MNSTNSEGLRRLEGLFNQDVLCELSFSEMEAIFSNALRGELPDEVLGRNGVYFTSDEMAKDLVSYLDDSRLCRIYDPACGTGALLVAYVSQWPIRESLSETLSVWSKYIYANDREDRFVQASKINLAIVAIKKGAKLDISYKDIVDKFFYNILVVDSLASSHFFKEAEIILMNPPFSLTKEYDFSRFSKGKINAAALFLEKVLNESSVGCNVAMIMPDVIRSGSRYKKIRDEVQKEFQGSTKSIGRFDRSVDVDVFFCKMKKIEGRQGQVEGFQRRKFEGKVISDYFDVHVGPVVPFRNKFEGDSVMYASPKNVPPWTIVDQLGASIQFSGTLYKAPFVLVRRTSSPKEKFRATASVVDVDGYVAVENHFIILLPKSDGLGRCLHLLKVLKTNSANEWLNSIIRCRHLTVESVKGVPYQEFYDG